MITAFKCLANHAEKRGGTGSAFADSLIHNATSNALQVDSEYSPRLFQNDVWKAQSSPQQRTALPLDNRIQMLGKSCQEKGELEGVVGTEPSIKHPIPPNLPLASTLGDYNSHAGKGEALVRIGG
ncbi:hypothetical protein SN11_26260 [Vibrio harveyi]|nr:hypothetical protein SN11_26260 [Vibrio harveyi]